METGYFCDVISLKYVVSGSRTIIVFTACVVIIFKLSWIIIWFTARMIRPRTKKFFTRYLLRGEDREITQLFKKRTEASKPWVTTKVLTDHSHQGFSNFLIDIPLVTKFNFHSCPNESIEYCQHFFLISLNVIMRRVNFLKNMLGFKINFFTKLISAYKI